MFHYLPPMFHYYILNLLDNATRFEYSLLYPVNITKGRNDGKTQQT